MKKVTTNEKRLSDWIKRMAYAKRDEGDFTRIQVRQVLNKSKSGDEVARFEVPIKEDRSESWDEDLATQIMSTLNIEASTLGGTQHYACYSVFSNHEGTVSRCIVTVYGTADDNDDDLVSEGPNAKGLVSMAQRHQEANARILTGSIMQVLETLRKQNDRLMGMNETLMEGRFEMLNEMAQVWDERRKQTLEENQQTVRTEALKEGIATVRAIAPVLINKAIGRDLLPVDKSAGVVSMAKSLFPSMTQEQHDALSKILRPDQTMQFYSLAEALLDDDDKEAKKTG